MTASDARVPYATASSTSGGGRAPDTRARPSRPQTNVASSTAAATAGTSATIGPAPGRELPSLDTTNTLTKHNTTQHLYSLWLMWPHCTVCVPEFAMATLVGS